MFEDFVFLLWHVDREKDAKLIGVYRSGEEARAAIGRVKDKPGFSEEGEFSISPYELNKTYWPEGFVRPPEQDPRATP